MSRKANTHECQSLLGPDVGFRCSYISDTCGYYFDWIHLPIHLQVLELGTRIFEANKAVIWLNQDSWKNPALATTVVEKFFMCRVHDIAAIAINAA